VISDGDGDDDDDYYYDYDYDYDDMYLSYNVHANTSIVFNITIIYYYSDSMFAILSY